ncbi:hypothetical protein [Ruminococcus bromii]|uniref:Uncharacterized protein n=1 Tax=Ruminococcus bromii TaxID=40518 RepID=A0A2N0UNL8_9FIRM|nr:hypothetical protein [Ruminococcus bromii]PKD28566.1 hypothetical protein RBATCC27255_01219 [Ruminococcus bromii]
MIEKLSLDFVRKIYNILTTGNDDVNFYCMCLQNQNREAATNNPVKFGLELIKINILCRLPFCNKRIFTKTVGKDYLSQIFVRPSICELASGMLDNSHLITDIFGSALTQIKSDDEIFAEIEKATGVKGFALLRKKYKKQSLALSEIYKKINAELKTLIDYKLELSLLKNSFLENRYIVRMIDIARCNDMKVSVVIKSIYPKDFVKHLLDKYRIGYDELIVNTVSNDVIETDDNNHTCAMSNNYDFIKRYAKMGCRQMYYRCPTVLMEHIDNPIKDEKFKMLYNTICGMNLFSGIKRMSNEYELGYMCIAPAIVGFASECVERLHNAEKMIFFCDENSIFAQTVRILSESTDKLMFFPWSALATDKYRTVAEWRKIIPEMPIFRYAKLGVLDKLMRYPISEINGDINTNELAKIMATAWIDKDSEGVKSAVKEIITDSNIVVTADHLPEKCASAEFAKVLSQIDENIVYNGITMSNYLCADSNDILPLSEIIQGNKPLLWKIDKSEKHWVYSKKIDTAILKEIYTAVCDFANDFVKYSKITDCKCKISGEDALSLYLSGIERLKNITQE